MRNMLKNPKICMLWVLDNSLVLNWDYFIYVSYDICVLSVFKVWFEILSIRYIYKLCSNIYID